MYPAIRKQLVTWWSCVSDDDIPKFLQAYAAAEQVHCTRQGGAAGMDPSCFHMCSLSIEYLP